VTVLGVAMVRSLAVSAAVFQAVGDELPAAEVDAVWRHSLETAVVARVLAARAGFAERDDAFTAGLLHDAGRLLLWRRFPDFYRTPPAGTALEQAERDTIGVDHATAGGWLFEAWQLPPALVAAVAQHHAGAPSHGLPATVAAANLMVHHPDGAVLLADPPDSHGATARAAAACCGLTCESWAEIAAGTGGATRS
jgi:putative nucleotidyltransferase with HDIG domain